jgi:4-diphosphocytidyl-2-C-methyl-D-erythritol kinase
MSRGADAPITVKAHAKLNVVLRVLGRREDGYHDLESLILPLDLHDLVTVLPGTDGLEMEAAGPRADDLPEEDANLVLRAARALAEAAGIEDPSARIALDKRIPVAAGMGGGSADAAATLHALDRLWGTDLGAAGLSEVAATVGSDVPALMPGGAVFVEGRGDRVHPVIVPTTWWVIAPQPFAVRTPDAFAWWDGEGTTGPDTGALVAAAETGNDALLGHALFNDLQVPVAARHPEVSTAVEAFLEVGAAGAVMTGSGPTVVALATGMAHADRLAEVLPGAFVASGPPVRARA